MFLKKSLEKKLEKSINILASNSDNDLLQSSYIMKAADKRKKNANDKRLNFSRGYKRFGDEIVKPQAKIAKAYVEQLRDPDILELLPSKRWNVSTKADDKHGTHELAKTLFEVRNGLRDVNIIKPTPKVVEMGTDSRNVYYVGWNNSTFLSNEEKTKINGESLEKAIRNTAKSWFEITEKNKVFGGTSSTFYPKDKGGSNFNTTNTNFHNTGFSQLNQHPQKFEYKSPSKIVEEKNNIIRKIKLEHQELKEKLRFQVKYDFPAASKEKISAIVYKRMNSTFSDELGKTMSKPWRKHKGIFGTTTSSFRNTQTTFNNSKMNTKTGFGNFNNGNNTEIHGKDDKIEEKEQGLNNFNMTGFSNAHFNKTQCTTGKGFFNSNLTTGISFFNKTKFSQFSENRSNSTHSLLPLPSKKKDYYSKKDWIEETKHHPGKWVSNLNI